MPNNPKAAALSTRHVSNAEREARIGREAALAGTAKSLTPPRYLSAALKKRHRKIVKMLREANEILCTDLDVDAVARYVMAEDEYLAAARDLAEFRADEEMPAYLADIDDPFQAAKAAIEWEKSRAAGLRKLQQAYNQAFSTANAAARAIGMTVDSRLRMALPKEEEKPPNRFAEDL